MKKLLLLFLLSIVLQPCVARQTAVKPIVAPTDTALPKPLPREFRAIWVATINNIDWPSTDWQSPEEQKQEFIDLLDYNRSLGINAVVVQVRPSADAFYPSALEPWSEWLNGRQGAAPNPFYDPLEFMVAECHKRDMEFHAWVNPFRAVSHLGSANIEPNHITRRRPEWFMTYGQIKLFNPGVPEVRDYLVEVLADLLMRYDIDGLHFDDYFYPYPDGISYLNDNKSYQKYGEAFADKEAYRRHSVNQFVEAVHTTVNQVKPYVKFGVSPFPIWRSMKETPDGVDTRTTVSSYKHLGADIRLWLEKGWIDYVAPQLYQHRKSTVILFDETLDWWARHTYGRHLYTGLAPYRVQNAKDPEWHNTSELPEQLRYNRYKQDEAGLAQGSIFYSASALLANKGGFADSLKSSLYSYAALPPAMPWKDSIAPLSTFSPVVDMAPRGVVVSWRPAQAAADGELPHKVAIYRRKTGNHEWKLLKLLPATTTDWLDDDARTPTDYQYALSMFDRLMNESTPVAAVYATMNEPLPLAPIADAELEASSKSFLKALKSFFTPDAR